MRYVLLTQAHISQPDSQTDHPSESRVLYHRALSPVASKSRGEPIHAQPAAHVRRPDFLPAFLLLSYAAAVPVDGYTPAGTASAKTRGDGASSPSHPCPRLHLLRGDAGAPVVATPPVIESEPSTAGKVARADRNTWLKSFAAPTRPPTYTCFLPDPLPDLVHRHPVALFALKLCVYPSGCPHFPIDSARMGKTRAALIFHRILCIGFSRRICKPDPKLPVWQLPV
ncbi:hypothetical protein C8R44DRAFT_880845 [Mycena epipterygia]|nr:hypothetical protein C8R44DRAFT_880845 [Mycena epipterygia]